MPTETLWHAIGIGGQLLFFSRFLVQWWNTERAGRVVIPIAFWYCSILGGAITLVYAVHRQEPVFAVAQAIGLVVYGRNLLIALRERSAPGLPGSA